MSTPIITVGSEFKNVQRKVSTVSNNEFKIAGIPEPMRANNVGSPHLAIDAPSTSHLTLRTTSLMSLLLSRYSDDHNGTVTSRLGNNK